jgi:HD-like signal output (HDOD) protein
MTQKQAAVVFKDCEPGSFPPLAGAYGVTAICEPELLKNEVVYMQSGCHTTLIKLEKSAFQQLMANVRMLSGCTCNAVLPEATNEALSVYHATPESQSDETALKARLKSIYRLPPMPDMAVKILKLTTDKRSSVDSLAAVIEQDPSLAAQMVKEASSPLYGFKGQIQSVKEAVVRVLGFERVCQIAMAIAAARAFDVPAEGRLGLQQLWRHALHSAVLAQKLALQMSRQDLDPALVYLSALLHNFGLLLMGHMFRPDYLLLSSKADQEPETELASVEQHALGMGGARELVGLGHGKLGAILLQQWNLPPEAVAVARHHQHPGYEGPHQDYIVLVQLANCLLKELQLGDDLKPDDPVYYSRRLGIDSALVFEIFEQLKASSASIDQIAGGS